MVPFFIICCHYPPSTSKLFLYMESNFGNELRYFLQSTHHVIWMLFFRYIWCWLFSWTCKRFFKRQKYSSCSDIYSDLLLIICFERQVDWKLSCLFSIKADTIWLPNWKLCCCNWLPYWQSANSQDFLGETWIMSLHIYRD